MRRALPPKAGRHLLRRQNGLGGVLFGIEADGEISEPFLPGRLPQHCPMSSIASPMSRTKRGLVRSPSRSASTVSPATASPTATPSS